MKSKTVRNLKVSLCLSAMSAFANAGVITSIGSVTALNDVSQLTNVLGTADFNLPNGNMSTTQYSAQGITFYDRQTLSSILPGVTTDGTAVAPYIQTYGASSYFPATISGGGTQDGSYAYYAGVATFSSELNVTQLGLTAGRNGTQYLTAWDLLGNMLGQVTWTPNSDAAFVGIDTGGVAIGMIAYGNDDLWGGATYDISGATIMSDNWIWSGSRTSVQNVPEPSAILLLGLGLAGIRLTTRRRKTAS